MLSFLNPDRLALLLLLLLLVEIDAKLGDFEALLRSDVPARLRGESKESVFFPINEDLGESNSLGRFLMKLYFNRVLL